MAVNSDDGAVRDAISGAKDVDASVAFRRAVQSPRCDRCIGPFRGSRLPRDQRGLDFRWRPGGREAATGFGVSTGVAAGGDARTGPSGSTRYGTGRIGEITSSRRLYAPRACVADLHESDADAIRSRFRRKPIAWN